MKKNRIFYQIFIPILALTTITIIILSTLMTSNSTHKMQQILELSVRDNLQQLAFNIENDLTLLESTLTSFSTSQSYRDIVSEPLLPQNISDYRSIVNQIQYLEALNGNNNVKYSITSLKGQWSITNGSLKQLSHEAIQQYEDEIIQQSHSTRQVIWDNKDGNIRFKAYLPYFSTRKTSIAQGTINKKALLDSIDSNSIDNLTIINRSGETLLTLKEFDIDSSELIAAIKHSNPDSGILTLNHRNYYYVTNSLGNRYYIMQFDTLSNKIHSENNLYILPILSILAIILISGTSFVIAKKIATPINQIKKSIEGVPFIQAVSNDNIDDLEYLSESIHAMITEQQSFNQLYEHGKPILKNQFIIQLLNNQVSQHTIDNRLNLYHYDTTSQMHYYILLTKIDYLLKYDDSSLDLWYFGINQLIKETIDSQYIFDATILNAETQVTILQFDRNDSLPLALQFAETIMENISSILKLHVSIGISNGHQNINQLHIAYQEAQQALQQKRNFNDSTIITYASLTQQGNDFLISFYPDDIEDKIKEEILVGNQEKALQLLESFFDRLNEYATSSIAVEIASIRLINSLLMLNQQLGLERVKMLHSKQSSSIYQRVTEFHNLHHIKHLIMEELIIPMLEENRSNTDSLFKTLSNEIKSIIKKNYNLDITLETIADDLHYNSNYLSNIFKREVGISFTDYLNNYRLKMAKKLLVETDLPIKEIAEQLRYTNSQNFIRFFKKNEGMTPGGYRQTYKK